MKILYVANRFVNYLSGGHPNMAMYILDAANTLGLKYKVASIEPYFLKTAPITKKTIDTKKIKKLWKVYSIPFGNDILWYSKVNRIYDVLASIMFFFEDEIKHVDIVHFLNVPAYVYNTLLGLRRNKYNFKIIVHIWYNNKQIGSPIYWLENRINFKYADRVIVTSSWLLRHYAKTLKDKVKLIYPPIDIEKFKPRNKFKARAQLGLPEDEFLVGHIGYLLDERGSFEVLKSLCILSHKLPFKLILAPLPLHTKYVRTFIEFYRRHRERIIIIHKLASPEVFYNAVDVVVLPYKSPYAATDPPLTIIETLASGTPLITSHVGGIRDFTIHEYNSIIVKPNAAEIADAIVRLYKHDALRVKLSVNARKTAEKLFNKYKIGKEILKIYKDFYKS